MAKVFVIEKNKHDKIELSKEELQEMLDDAYAQGYTDAKTRFSSATYLTSPCYSGIHCLDSKSTNKESVIL